jgi:hypothetical protein
MRTHVRRTFLIVPLLLAGVLAAAAPAAIAAPAAPPAPTAPLDDPGDHVVACDGGAQNRALVRLNDTPTPLVENATFAALPGATIPFAVPNNQTRQVIAIFTAESVLNGQPLTYVVPADALRIRILLDGAPMPPADNVIFTTDVGESNAAQACKRVPAGNHVVTVEWWLEDINMNSVLTGTLNKWVLHLEINA